jgi:hypothetical protein
VGVLLIASAYLNTLVKLQESRVNSPFGFFVQLLRLLFQLLESSLRILIDWVLCNITLLSLSAPSFSHAKTSRSYNVELLPNRLRCLHKHVSNSGHLIIWETSVLAQCCVKSLSNSFFRRCLDAPKSKRRKPSGSRALCHKYLEDIRGVF